MTGKTEHKQRFYFWILMASAHIATVVFALLYYMAGIDLLVKIPLITMLFFSILTVSTWRVKNLVPYYRLSIAVIYAAFFVQVFYTGGINSAAVPEFFIVAVIAFFYKPVKDRYVTIVISLIATVAMLFLSYSGKTENLVPVEYERAHSFICYVFVMVYLMVYVFLFRDSLMRKNKRLTKSITDLENTTAKLIETEKMTSIAMLSSGLAHELNNPLNYISGLVGPLKQNLKDLKPLIAESKQLESEPLFNEAEEFLNVISSGAGKAAFIIKKLIQISPQGGVSATSNFDLADTLHISSQIIKESHPEFDLEISLNKGLSIHGNQVEINQMFLNIIENSVEAIKGKSKGLIKIEGSTNNDHVVVSINDNGRGMSSRTISHLFEPFYTNKSPGEGTGLGLYISKSIAKKYGGTINVISEEGVGSTFTVRFPEIKEN